MKCVLYFVSFCLCYNICHTESSLTYHENEFYYDKPQTPLQKIRDFIGNVLNKFKSGNLLQDIDRQFGAVPPNVLFAAGAGSVAFAGVAVQTGIAEDLINELNNLINPTTPTTSTTTKCLRDDDCDISHEYCDVTDDSCQSFSGYEFKEQYNCHSPSSDFYDTLNGAIEACNAMSNCDCVDDRNGRGYRACRRSSPGPLSTSNAWIPT